MSVLRISAVLLIGILLSGLFSYAPAWAEKSEKMVDLGDQSDTVKPYYDIYEPNHTYVEDARRHREAMDARRARYVAPLISSRAAGMMGRGQEGQGVSSLFTPPGLTATPSAESSDVASSQDQGPTDQTSKTANLSEDEVRAFISQTKAKTIAATKKADIAALNDLTRQMAAPSYTISMKIDTYMDGKFAGTASNTLTRDQTLAFNQEIAKMSDVSMDYEIMSIAITSGEAVINDRSTTKSKTNVPSIGTVSAEVIATCTDTIRRQPDGKLAYTKSVCKVRSNMNKDLPI